MRKWLNLGLMLTLVAIGLAGGRTAAAQGSGLPAAMIGREWALASLQSAPGSSTNTAGKGILLRFAADGTMSGNDGCNNFAGTYTSSGAGAIKITLGPSTLIACPDEVNQLAQEYVTALGAITNYTYTAPGSLELNDGAGIELAFTTAVTGGPATLPTTGGAPDLGLAMALLALTLLAGGLGLRQWSAGRA